MALKHSHRNEINSREEICVIKWNSYNDAQKFSTREGENDAGNWNQSHEKPRKTTAWWLARDRSNLFTT